MVTERVISDVNGSCFPHKSRPYGILTEGEIDDDAVALFNELKKAPAYEMSFEQKMRVFLGIEDKDQGILQQLRPDWSKWGPLKSTDYKGINVRHLLSLVRGYASYNEQFDKFFNDYHLPPENIETLSQLHSRQIRVTFTSGIVYNARKRFFKEMKEVLPYSDPNLLALLSPNESIHGMPLKFGAVGFLDSQANGYQENQTLVEDDYYIAKIIAGVLNTRVILPMSESEAKSQPHLKSKRYPSAFSPDNGEIVFAERFANILKYI